MTTLTSKDNLDSGALSIKQILSCSDDSLLNQEICVQGWVRSRRDSKAGLSFIALSDGSCFQTLQIIINGDLANYQEEVLKLTKDCSIRVIGKLVASEGAGQDFEIQANSLEVLGWVESPDTYPVSPKRHTREYLRNYAHLRPRTNLFGAITRLRNTCSFAIHKFFNTNGFFWINTPILTASDCEGAGELFRVSNLDMQNLPLKEKGEIDFNQDFFQKEAFLTVSGQLNAECYALAMSKVYTFGPTFRAENSNTSRHLAEFWMIEPEMAFANLSDDMDCAENLFKFIVKECLENCQDDLEFFNKWVNKGLLDRLNSYISKPFARLTYTDAINKLLESGKKFDFPVEWGCDLQSEHERYLAEQYIKGPVFITDYPAGIKAFYMRLNDEKIDGKSTVAAMDLLLPGIGELIGGAQREERLDVLDLRIKSIGMEPSDYSWYRDLRRYGTVPHAGFGMGFERLLGVLSGVENVRDLIPFPRVPGSISF